MSDFQKFSKLIHDRYKALAAGELFIVGTDNHAFSDAYLAAFPPGTNPVYKTNTEHDCSCCKNFIRNLGNVVAIVDGQIQTVWNVQGAPHPYDVVASAMDAFVKSQPIAHIFRTSERKYGAESTVQQNEDGSAKRWNHFHGDVAKRHLTGEPAQRIGEHNANVQVFKRGLNELTIEAIDSVIELIESNALYRGAEHKTAIVEFKALHKAYNARNQEEKELFIWSHADAPFSRFRNTVIGTLVQDLSDGVAMEDAVRSFETKVAPTNYKRPTALITPSMIKSAMVTIKELDLEQALERRFAKISDVGVSNVLWVNNSVKGKMKGGIENLLLDSVATDIPDGSTAMNVGIDKFMSDILPSATDIEVFVKGSQQNNFMSITAPVHENSGKLFKWANDFGWSYDGNITDSIKDKVKAAGGNVTNAKLRVSLAWFNYDDLDIHVIEPSGNHIYFGNKCGNLDVDMNAGSGKSRTPVENVSWTRLADGKYQVYVNQYLQRESSDVGCVVEIEIAGRIIQLSHPTVLRGNVPFATITIRNGIFANLEPAAGIVAGGISQEKWGVKTETYVPVETLMFSPNHWDENAVGNKHWFFILKGCKNPEATRGIYNEFLNSSLEKHRKVFEVLGDKTKCQPSADQLSGIGFSSTKQDSVIVKVTSHKATRLFNIVF